MKIGVAGLGRMGAALAKRLKEVGHEVTVWNRTPDKAKPLAEAGMAVAGSPTDLAAKCEAVITMLTNAEAIDAVYHGPSGLLAGDVKGKLFIDMSTVLPATEVALAEKVRGKGAAFVECPVGGSVAPALSGQLLGLMGAEPADAERARPILEKLCRRLEHCGPVGAGAVTKLAVNLPLMISWQAFGEAFALMRTLGWEPKRLLDLFVDTNGATPALKNRAPMITTMLEGKDPGPVTFSISNAAKDVRFMAAEGKAHGVELPLIEQAVRCFEECDRAGWSGQDGSSLIVYWANRGK